MKKDSPVSRIVDGSYRVTRSSGHLLIEVLDYHAEPLVLEAGLLEELGLVFAAEEPRGRRDSTRPPAVRPRRRPVPERHDTPRS